MKSTCDGETDAGVRKRSSPARQLSSSRFPCLPAILQHRNISSMQSTDDMADYLTNLEETFYQQGMANGLPHGELHGLFEGRALGREKGWEIWEEVGYYEGTALLWRAILLAQGKQGLRCVSLQLRSAAQTHLAVTPTEPTPIWTRSYPWSILFPSQTIRPRSLQPPNPPNPPRAPRSTFPLCLPPFAPSIEPHAPP